MGQKPTSSNPGAPSNPIRPRFRKRTTVSTVSHKAPTVRQEISPAVFFIVVLGPHTPTPLPFMREPGTRWQINGNWRSRSKAVHFFWSKMGRFRFWHYNIKRDFRGIWSIPSTCLDASRKWFSTGTYSINRASERLWLETPQKPSKWPNVHGFQVRTPICHIVPVSRAYPPSPQMY